MLTYEQSVFNRYNSDKHFSQFLPTRWRQKSTGIDMEQNYATVTPCIQLAQCRFPGLAISNSKILVYFFQKNVRKQFYQTALGNCYGLNLAKC